MKFYNKEFPFEEIRDDVCGGHGDYFDSLDHAVQSTRLPQDHIWSVVCVGDEDEKGVEFDAFCYGPPHHYINLIGFIATNEKHDNETYYEERIYLDNDLENLK
tara:strand:- start:6930 stop:7238 length:309 start_codon:yes stop_codon:yes gene_type:complete